MGLFWGSLGQSLGLWGPSRSETRTSEEENMRQAKHIKIHSGVWCSCFSPYPKMGFLLLLGRRRLLREHLLLLSFSPHLTLTHSYSDLLIPRLIDLLIPRLTHTQTYSYSDLLILRLTHTQTYSYSDLLMLRLTHTQTYSYSDSYPDLLILRPTHTQTYSYSDLLIV